ncbi:MAG: helix-turn-helix transcriptional regulator [Methylobacteriaceae bacterium]|nr:helix-turn-helix transcriptional regulator [Methylobacteriaceae bacterium]
MAAAARYFAEVGFSGPTRDLARRVGVTQPLLYKYFASKADLVEAVFARVYLDRLDPGWRALIVDRRRPLRARMVEFYRRYTDAIFTYEWMRIFMFAGLAGENLNARYLEHVRELLMKPLLAEISAAAPARKPDIEDMWSLHGSIIYLGIRKHIYQWPAPDDALPAIERAIDRFLGEFAPAARAVSPEVSPPRASTPPRRARS